MIHKREPGFLIMGLTFVPIITEVTRSSGDAPSYDNCCVWFVCCLSFLMLDGFDVDVDVDEEIDLVGNVDANAR